MITKITQTICFDASMLYAEHLTTKLEHEFYDNNEEGKYRIKVNAAEHLGGEREYSRVIVDDKGAEQYSVIVKLFAETFDLDEWE